MVPKVGSFTPQANVLSCVPIFLNCDDVKPSEKHCLSQKAPEEVATNPGPNPTAGAAVTTLSQLQQRVKTHN